MTKKSVKDTYFNGVFLDNMYKDQRANVSELLDNVINHSCKEMTKRLCTLLCTYSKSVIFCYKLNWDGQQNAPLTTYNLYISTNLI